MGPSLHIKTFFKVLSILAGSGIALALAMMAVDPENPALVLASLGGSSFYLFALTTSPASQPRALMGGHVIAALIGVAAYHFLGNAPWAPKTDTKITNKLRLRMTRCSTCVLCKFSI